VRLIIQPEDGVKPLIDGIDRAKKSVEIAIFRFDRREIERALENAVRRGVFVHALIADTNRSGEKNLRKLEMRLLAKGMTVARTSNDLLRYHGKMMIVDRRELFVLAFNFTRLDIDHSRSFGIVTQNRHLVQEAIKLFESDSCLRNGPASQPSASRRPHSEDDARRGTTDPVPNHQGVLRRSRRKRLQGRSLVLRETRRSLLGSRDYEHAKEAAQKVDRDNLKNWELETMVKQFTYIARIQAQKEGKGDNEVETADAWSVVKIFLGGDAAAALSFLHGKVGLALSGGGFRASLYHIGVMASLAEQDMLRHVRNVAEPTKPVRCPMRGL